MEEDKGGAGTSSRVTATLALPAPTPPPPLPLPLPPPQPPAAASSKPPKESGKRQMFAVELKPGETTIVSWKKLLREASKETAIPSASSAAAAADSRGGPAAASASAPAQPPDGELQDEPPSNRFSAVIEKIERLYMGKQSSDEEELDDIPDDDQYDTEDSFIDDAELDEYFQVDKLSTKHNGYFVNRGKLENIEPSSSPNLAPKKRRRKDSTNVNTENKHQHATTGLTTTDNVRIKAAARSAPFIEKKIASSAKKQTAFDEHYHESKTLKHKLNASSGTLKKKSADSTMNSENPSSVRSLKDGSSLPLESRDLEKNKAGVIQSRDLSHKSRLVNESSEVAHHASRDRSISYQVESHPRRSVKAENEEVPAKIRRKERYRTDRFPSMNSVAGAYPMQSTQPSSTRLKEGSALRPKGTTLERAIQDLEKIVALCRPHKLDLVEMDAQSPGVKRRLPQEVKHKLAKVARLSANQNKISEEDLIDRLMGIVGHIVQRKTLKRNLREMVELGISAKQQKADRFQQVKQEVNEMIRTRVSLLKSKVAEQQDGSADDFQEVNGNDEKKAIRKYGLDIALEDKICDLYDLYMEGIDEDKGPPSRKFYAELAELWPNGYMDSNGIKDAISRSRDRKRSRICRDKARNEERLKRKRLASTTKLEENSTGPQLQSPQERTATDSTGQALVSTEKIAAIDQPVTSSGRALETSPRSTHSAHNLSSKHHEKVRASTATDNGSRTILADVKKKMKRKPESELGDVHAHPTKLQLKEKPSSHKQHGDDTNINQQPKLTSQLPAGAAASNQQN